MHAPAEIPIGASVRVISFGYGHAPAPESDLTIDARRVSKPVIRR